ncbi:MAG: branched-chain amino acid ABC transporter permease [Bacteroidales bacterium]|nr:branched-chain amino acid ABC transporter permease [Bacteroidales bacterium]
MEYLIHIGIILGIYSILIASAQLVIGHARLITLGQGAFFGAGAYFMALSMIHLKLPFAAALLLAVVGNSLIGLLLALPAVKLKGDFFVLTTLGFQFIIFQLTYNLKGVTGGSTGLGNIPFIKLPGIWPGNESSYLLLLTVVLTVLVFLLLHRLQKSTFGRNLRAMVDHEILYKASGRSEIKIKAQVIAISAGTTAAASALFAVYMNFLDPQAFNLDKSILILTGVMLGGLSRLRHALIGALTITLIPEVLRLAGLPAAEGASIRQILFGLVLVVLVFYAALKRHNQGERDMK